jgi:FAD/FMN-containing dehydrogenase/Fe-S oxidoreductase
VFAYLCPFNLFCFMQHALARLAHQLDGEFFADQTMRTLYATDASAYREMPLAVAIPKTEADLKRLIQFARQFKTSLIPRTAGTSLAGQVVGNGIVVDVSRHFNKILEINPQERWVRVQPGVVRDELNLALRPHGLFFGPETSTANRAMIGGMVGNNSCGSNSIVYGSTRDHLLQVRALLSDGTEAEFGALSADQVAAKCRGEQVAGPLEQAIYQQITQLLADPANQAEIRREYPKASIRRRNTGYALDELMEQRPFNFCQLLAGSEGTLVFLTELKLNLVDLPPKHQALVCVHCASVDESLRANLVAVQHGPSASELMDHYVLECTKTNPEQRQNRFFVQGDPGAILVVELSRPTPEELDRDTDNLINELKANQLGYHYPVLRGEDSKKVWALRKAGLGLLSNLPGDAKPVAVIEDTAVDVADLPAYIREFNAILKTYGLYSVHYAHAGSGEIHLRPIIDLKTHEGNRLFKTIADEIAILVKKYGGSLSGEHGDGRLRGEYIRQMVGEHNYGLICQVKQAFDPENIFNPGKIVDTPPMNTHLRYTPGQATPEFATVLDFSANGGILRAAELCNGSGDCRKTHLSGGTMCPSYMATRNERDTTRARANILREFLTNSRKQNRFDHEEIKDVMDLCLSCKGCKSECPSNVDVGKMKAEFLQQYYDANGVPFRTQLIGHFTSLMALASATPRLFNFLATNPLTAPLVKGFAGFAAQRSMPLLHRQTLRAWWEKRPRPTTPGRRKVYLFVDEFTNYNDVEIGQTAIQLLEKLGYTVELPRHLESGRTYLSKGLLRRAKSIAMRNVDLLKGLVSEDTPLIGIEPSAILTFRDEYLDLVPAYQKADAEKIASHSLMIDEFLAREREAGHLRPDQFTNEKRVVKLHGHCHQKALASVAPTKKMLTLPANYEVQLIPSGCCGMAGSFGYEAEHFEVSMQVGELVLFPAVRAAAPEVIIAAPGTSCRHQIKDGTGRHALHPVEVLWGAVR